MSATSRDEGRKEVPADSDGPAESERTVAKAADGYHHGDLPTALRAATADLVAERGPTGFSLREVARRAGVSHAAPAHHFGGSKGLLTSVAVEGFNRLDAAFNEVAAATDDPIDRLTAMGKAYVGVALDYPGHFAVMWADSLINNEDPDFQEVASKAFDHLLACITAIAEAHNPDLDIASAVAMTWSAVHGLAMLSCTFEEMDKPETRSVADVEATIEAFSHHMMNGYAAR